MSRRYGFPFFLRGRKRLLADDPDAIYIIRRTLSDKYRSVDEIPMMFADMGEDHPGTDCFIIKRELVEKLILEKSVIGAEFSAFALDVNLRTFAPSVAWHRRLHLTFHIGDPRPWAAQHDYGLYNLAEVQAILEKIDASDHSINRKMLDIFRQDLQAKRARILERTRLEQH